MRHTLYASHCSNITFFFSILLLCPGTVFPQTSIWLLRAPMEAHRWKNSITHPRLVFGYSECQGKIKIQLFLKGVVIITNWTTNAHWARRGMKFRGTENSLTFASSDYCLAGLMILTSPICPWPMFWKWLLKFPVWRMVVGLATHPLRHCQTR